MMTTIIKCDCKSEYQDKTYGNRNRVANIRAGKNDEKCRCTVCGKEHSVPSSPIVEKNS